MSCLSGLRSNRSSLVSLLLVFLGTAALGSPQGTPSSSSAYPSEQERLQAVARLWTAIKYFHPSVASKPIDWDQALVRALPAIRTAANESEFAAAVQSLLAPLGDPITAVNAPPPVAAGATLQRTWIHHGLPSALPGAAGFYQAFSITSGKTPAIAVLSLTPTVSAQVRLSDTPSSAVAVPSPLPDSDYADTPYPSTGLRILSAFRIWGTIHNFFAYKDLMDEDWDAVFAEFLPKFIASKDARSYHLAVADTISRLTDSNSTVESRELDAYFGEAAPALTIRMVEKRPVVLSINDPSLKALGIHVGDVVTSVDGEKSSDRIKREANYVSASTPQGLSAVLAARFLNGPPESEATLTLTGASERAETVRVKRNLRSMPDTPAIREGAIRILSSNIGYVDLTRLTPAEVDGMFERLQSTTALIFDARGPVAPLASAIAACVVTRPEVTTAVITAPLALEPDLPRPGISTSTSSYFVMESVRPNCRHPYKGKTVMLIDERTVGNGEHLGIALAAANNTEFLGTPSAGAVSAVTEFSAPGGIRIRFSGQDIRYGNGGPIQRTGLQPSIALAPKIIGIRTGRDIVIDKAIEYLRPPSVPASLPGVQQVRPLLMQSDN